MIKGIRGKCAKLRYQLYIHDKETKIWDKDKMFCNMQSIADELGISYPTIVNIKNNKSTKLGKKYRVIKLKR